MYRLSKQFISLMFPIEVVKGDQKKFIYFEHKLWEIINVALRIMMVVNSKIKFGHYRRLLIFLKIPLVAQKKFNQWVSLLQ